MIRPSDLELIARVWAQKLRAADEKKFMPDPRQREFVGEDLLQLLNPQAGALIMDTPDSRILPGDVMYYSNNPPFQIDDTGKVYGWTPEELLRKEGMRRLIGGETPLPKSNPSPPEPESEEED